MPGPMPSGRPPLPEALPFLPVLCVAAPVRDTSGSIVAAISVTATRPYMPPERLDRLGPRLDRAKAQQALNEAPGAQRERLAAAIARPAQ